jgi:CBS domain-containing protein
VIFLSDFLGADLVDVNQKRVGTVKDVLVRMRDPYPVVTGLAIHSGRKLPNTISFDGVRQAGTNELSLRLPAAALNEYEHADEATWLSRDILDKQIVDIDGRRLVRVNDLQLQQEGDLWLVVGVDVGARGLLRRLGLEEVMRKVMRVLHVNLPQKLVSWDAVDPVHSDMHAMKLRISHRKLSKLHPADIADIVGELSSNEREAIFRDLDDEVAADALEESSEETQSQVLMHLDDERAADIVEEMEPDEAADVLADLPEKRRQEIIAKMDSHEAGEVQELLAYPKDVAGGLMTTGYISVPPHITTGEAIELLREQAHEASAVNYIYVVSDEERLLGVITLKHLVLAPPGTKIESLMHSRVVAVQLETHQDEVVSIMTKYNLLAVPVVDEHDHLQGIVKVDDAMEALIPQSVYRKAQAI